MVKYCFIQVFLLLPFAVLCQKEDHVWLFGYNSLTGAEGRGPCLLDFNHEPPLAYEHERDMNFDMTVASNCDENGDLLLYTNGIFIANHEHELMENGDSLNPGEIAYDYVPQGYPVTQSTIFIPSPYDDTHYTLFHLQLDYHDSLVLARTTFYTTLVDISLNSGQGKVISKNDVLIENGNLGKITTIKHANGRDWWIVVSDSHSNNYHVFIHDPQGVEKVKEQILPPSFSTNTNGTIVFSPDGTKMARYEVPLKKLMVYGFDRCSGDFFPFETVNTPNVNLGGGVSFSPDSRFIYILSTNYIFQYDLAADNIASSLDTVAVYDGSVSNFPTTFFLSQLGPDGRIYINTTNNTDILHVINYPNKKGNACQVLQGGLQLPTRNRFTSQHFPNYRLGPLDGSPCDTLGLDNVPVAKFRYGQDTMDYLTVEFTDLSYYEPTGWAWDFGDNTTSAKKDPVHTFPQYGTYEVCLTVSNQYGQHTSCRFLELGTVSSTEEAARANINVFPNPCRDIVNFIVSDYLPFEAKVVLYDMAGQRQLVQKVQVGWNSIRMDEIQAGIYFYEVWEGDVLLEAGKLVKVE